jgi:NCS1 family nucleobase:cation symporter-1
MTVQSMEQSSAVAETSGGETSWPLLQSERSWTSWKLAMVITVTACATWCYIIGEYVGYYLNLPMGTAAMIAGGMIGMLIVTLAVVPPATRFGIDSVVASVPQFGTRGWALTIIPQYASILGWNAILLIFFGKNVAKIIELLGFAPEVVSWAGPIVTIAACGICYLVLLAGTTGLEKVSTVLFFFIVGVGAWIVYLLVTEQSAAIAAAKPAYASESLRWNYTTGIEVALVSNLSWWAYAGAMMRQSPNAHTAALPSMLGMGLPVPLLSIIGLASILALQTSDPSEWMVKLGGPVYGAIALVFVAAANFGTILAGVYSSAIGLRQVSVFSRASWSALLGVGLLPIFLMGLLIPNLVFDNFGTFLAFIGLAFGPICGIQIVDYLVLRKQKVAVRGLYDHSAGSPYYFWGGFNPAGIIAMAAGIGTYLYLLNPLTYESRFPYEYTTAGLPTVVVSGLVYLLLTLIIVKPAGKGGYGS